MCVPSFNFVTLTCSSWEKKNNKNLSDEVEQSMMEGKNDERILGKSSIAPFSKGYKNHVNL